MIEIKDVVKSYDGGKTLASDHIDLTIQDGEIFGLLGPNGAGKSTLLKMMVGIFSPDQGEICLNGLQIKDDARRAKKEFGYVSDTPDHLLRLTGYEFLRFMADVYEVPPADRAVRVEELAQEFGMQGELDNQIQTYSHGMRQKMMVMGALISNPNIWILDEPMTGLDPKASYLLKQRMRRHADEGKIVLFSTHVLDVAEKVVDRIGIINKGKLLFVGTVPEMRAHFQNNASLEEMFLELTSGDSPFEEGGSMREIEAEDEQTH